MKVGILLMIIRLTSSFNRWRKRVTPLKNLTALLLILSNLGLKLPVGSFRN